MLDAQSPWIRRRRALSYNIDQFRKGFIKSTRLTLPAVRSASDLHESQHLKERNQDTVVDSMIDPKVSLASKEQHQQQLRRPSLSNDSKTDEGVLIRHKRYDAEQKNVRVSHYKKSQNYDGEVQYRLSAISPMELRRRRYRKSRGGNSGVGEGVVEKSSNLKNDDTGHDDNKPTGICNKCLARIGNLLTELTIFVLSQSKQNYSVGFVNKFLYWTFRKNFFIVLLAAACSFYLFTVTFAVFIYLIGKSNPKCIHVNGVDFDETRTQFIDAFALSWTTFSTVGYGLVYPATSATIPEDFNIAKECTGMAIVTTMEAFVGILFSGVWGAICFAKVTRVSAFAQVSFTDVIIVKYGIGVTGVVKDDEYEEGSSDDDDQHRFPGFSYKQSKLPCPILEFRIANRLCRQRGGEIIDACINIIASMEESHATRSIRNGAGMEPKVRRKGRRPKKRGPQKNIRIQNFDGSDNRTYGEIMNEENIRKAQEAARNMVIVYTSEAAKLERTPLMGSSGRSINNNEQPHVEQATRSTEKDKPIPNHIFAKLNVESLEHPFFKRVWNVRHVLDATSPLLKQEARDLIRINKGHWPEELNNAIGVRASIHFDQILVSFSGTSNVDANSVYSQKAYNFGDVCVGYSFCNMLFREWDGSIGVDHTLLNDVKEQSGGGGEELFVRDQETSNRNLPDIFIL